MTASSRAAAPASLAAEGEGLPTTEAGRLAERDHAAVPWGLWGSYLSERQWGTVREDYSAEGDAWRSFPHDHARSRAYRWGEDGLLGLCDEQCRLCFSLALWNGRDPILKERPFGLANPEGNHGEDLKDYFFHLANTPTHSFMRGLYRYPQRAFPYQHLLEENARRGREEPEYELIDTGVFADNRYFDVIVEYAKRTPHDILIRLRARNRGPEAAPLTLLPTLWLRNTWSWGYPDERRRAIQLDPASGDAVVVDPAPHLGEYRLVCRESGQWLFTDNETNTARLWGKANANPYQKDGFHRFVVEGEEGAINPAGAGSKAAILLRRTLAPDEEWVVDLRLTASAEGLRAAPFDATFDALFAAREQEWLDFFDQRVPGLGEEDRAILLAGAAGLLWSKKYYGWSVLRWLEGDPTSPPPPKERWLSGNAYWKRLHAHDIIAMPDGWEYPYFCQWDLMFHAVCFAQIDPETAKRQCLLLRNPHYTAPNAQTPAYEWELSDPNPPIGAWAAMRIFQIERKSFDTADLGFLRMAFRKLMLEYGWWANRNDRSGFNVFEGGFLGLDNIAVFDRRFPLADGSVIEQCDGTAWMAALSLNLLQIAVELSREEPEYADLCERFVVDFAQLSLSLNNPVQREFHNWDEEDGFYYDVIRRPDGSCELLRTRSLSGLIPLLAVQSFDVDTVSALPMLDMERSLTWFLHERNDPDWVKEHFCHWRHDRLLFTLVTEERLRRICQRLFDEEEFLSPYGLRSLSKVYGEHPYTFTEGDESQTLAYCPGDSPVAMFGGNSNWRGPIWMPMNFLLIEALQKFSHFYGDDLQVEFPTRSGRWLNLWQVSLELEQRLLSLFRRDSSGRRPWQGQDDRFLRDPHWRDLFLFHEYFHGDDGHGLGASHQTGWTALVCKMLDQVSRYAES
ncbi:MAG: glucosidase [Cyanobacteria bacterium K_Offshore_surface_m2_239]|nr:glucosidase [Cyanobacteria bacterium K_Offshore_surface_m2_239]